MTFRQFAEIYKERHVFAKKLAIGKTIDYPLKRIIEDFSESTRRRDSNGGCRAAGRVDRGETLTPVRWTGPDYGEDLDV